MECIYIYIFKNISFLILFIHFLGGRDWFCVALLWLENSSPTQADAIPSTSCSVSVKSSVMMSGSGMVASVWGGIVNFEVFHISLHKSGP